MAGAKKKQADKSVTRVNVSFTCLPDLLEQAKEFCWQQRISFSSKMEDLLREWVEQEEQKEPKKKP
jgi:hypothetical protein